MRPYHPARRQAVIHALLLFTVRVALVAQVTPDSSAGSRAGPAANYLERFAEATHPVQPRASAAEVNHLVLSRGGGRLTLERGTLYQLAPVGGRAAWAVFRGDGLFSFQPVLRTEQEQLRRLARVPALNDTINLAILIFADSTADQLRGLSFTAAQIPGDLVRRVGELVASLRGEKEGDFPAEVMGPLLNGDTSGVFLALVDRPHGGQLLFELSPDDAEAVKLYRPVSRTRWGTNWALITESPLHPTQGAAAAWAYRDRLRVPRYRIDTDLPLTGSAGVNFTAAATLALRAIEPVGPWLAFRLDPKLVVDSARWGDGAPAPFFKADRGSTCWVRAPRRLSTGDTSSFSIYYHGDLVDRVGDWFFVDPTADWYPVNGQGPDLATFDLTFHSPASYPLVSIGERTDSSLANRVVTSHWVARRPTPYATFSLGTFEARHIQNPGAPALDVLLSERAHTAMRAQVAREGGYLSQQAHMTENVAADVSNSLRTFTFLFGSSPFEHFYVTEIPYGEGVSFPGLIDLSWATFQNTQLDGFDEFFRAHEVAHQWWGNGVRPASYRDAWLSEGLASFSALWYLQLERRHYDEYFRFLDEYQTLLRADHELLGPIWIGHRNGTPDEGRGYQLAVYDKGAWVFHMLRAMMLDLRTRSEDRFTDMMRDFYTSYLGAAATTGDFQSVVERHVGMDMSWFFDQWVKGTDVPTYHVAWRSEPADSGKFRIRLKISQEHVPADFRMPVLVAADLGENRLAHFRIDVRGTQAEYTSPVIPSEPRRVIFNEHHSVLADVRMEHW